MVDAGSGRRFRAVVIWVLALLVVPAVLAYLAQAWPGPQLESTLRADTEAALSDRGLGPVVVSVDGRDVRLDNIPIGAGRSAAEVAASVPGVRAVRIGTAEVVQASPPGTAPTAAVPTAAPLTSTALDPAAAQLLTTGIAEAIKAAPITFAADSDELTEAPAATVRRVTELLVAQPTARVALDGYVADTPGSPETAVDLSQRRAAVVAEALVAGGVDRARITATGRGAANQLDSAAASRRVEISVS
ncbi:OmpA family protein [Pseudonocardia sp. TRM90224]|uniref:OmpA family protein n=1 Tax=Pseudonocardia sp. TRM90224 TaxID=2812678 RepID=UPI001E4F7DFD|nr:OmpA family protein [Pseudonocardia sp. TRM90224]